MTTAPPITPTPPAASPAGPPPVTERVRHRVRYALVGAVLVGALGFLLFKGLGTALNFYLPVNQAIQQRPSLGSRTFNLEGLVVPGSIHPTARGVDFTLSAGGDTMHVFNQGSPPQLFQKDIPVIAVGHFSTGGFSSDEIMVKHSATYIAQNPGRVTAPNGTKR